MARRLASLLCFLVVAGSTGCAVYEHRLIEPAAFAGPVDGEGILIPIEPLEYHAYDARGRLGLSIINHSAAPITLLGERSYLVDPTGETRAVLGGTIAPGSHRTMFLPPAVEAVRPGPRFGVGIGVGVGGRIGAGHVGAFHDPWRRHPAYVREHLPLWRWITGTVRMHFVYERGDERFSHALEFERVKVK